VASPLGQRIGARRRELENRDKPNPSLDKVTKIAAALNLTPEALLGSSTPDSQSETDKAFFRKYQQLTDDDKAKLRQLVDTWWGE
jgi:transcriptional regulator with XRE-family HTH domain